MKKPKIPFDLRLFLILFLEYFHLFIVYFNCLLSFYIWSNIKFSISLNCNDKKIIVKVLKYPLMPGLNVLLPNVSWSFNHARENTYLFLVNLKMINGPYEKTSMPLQVSIKFFGWKGKNTITLFQLGVSKKIEKSIKSRKPEKHNQKSRIVKKIN
jgi:hypothetical protein